MLEPKADILTTTLHNSVLLLRHLLRSNKLLEDFRKRIVVPRIKRITSSSDFPEDIPIPRIKASETSPDEFKKHLDNAISPVVIEGLASESKAVKLWTPEYFHQHYGNVKVPIRYFTDEHDTLGKHRDGLLSEVTQDILDNKKNRHYLDNIADLFNDFPELERALPINELADYSHSHLFGTQLFLGGQETGTAFHCANGHNFFIMIHGEKEWFFVHPKHTLWMEAKMQLDAIYMYTDLDHNKSREEQEQCYPLYNRIPKYKTILKPGDVLFNPSWWWHAINNKTDATIGVATRWPHILESIKVSWFPTFLQGLTPHQWKVVLQFLLNKRMKDRDTKKRFDNT